MGVFYTKMFSRKHKAFVAFKLVHLRITHQKASPCIYLKSTNKS